MEANGRVNSASDGTPLSFPGVLIDIEERRAVEPLTAYSDVSGKLTR
nr:hypothetical protein [Aureimonas sp. AU40]